MAVPLDSFEGIIGVLAVYRRDRDNSGQLGAGCKAVFSERAERGQAAGRVLDRHADHRGGWRAAGVGDQAAHLSALALIQRTDIRRLVYHNYIIILKQNQVGKFWNLHITQ